MIDGNKISVLITSHKSRFDTLDQVIQSWITQPVDEIWVIDDGNNFRTEIKDPRLLIFNMPKDFETKSDYALALLTEGDLIILADDDILVKNNLVRDLYSGYKNTNNSIVGVYGKIFFGPSFYKNTRPYRGNRVKKPVKVDFVGIMFMAERKYFGFDTKGMHKNCDDFWFCLKIHKDVDKYVVPVNIYTDLPCSYNNTAMHKTKAVRKPRIDFYSNYYNNLKDKNCEPNIIIQNKIKKRLKKKNRKNTKLLNEIWNKLHSEKIND